MGKQRVIFSHTYINVHAHAHARTHARSLARSHTHACTHAHAHLLANISILIQRIIHLSVAILRKMVLSGERRMRFQHRLLVSRILHFYRFLFYFSVYARVRVRASCTHVALGVRVCTWVCQVHARVRMIPYISLCTL